VKTWMMFFILTAILFFITKGIPEIELYVLYFCTGWFLMDRAKELDND